jgi:hypothetical protein
MRDWIKLTVIYGAAVAFVAIAVTLLSTDERPPETLADQLGMAENLTYMSIAGRGHYSAPVWSPDGSHLAFVFFSSADATTTLWIANMDTGATRIAETGGHLPYGMQIAWRDNAHVAFLSDGDLFSTDIATDEVERLYRDAATWIGVAIDPNDGNRLIVSWYPRYDVTGLFRADLYEIDLATQTVTQITDTDDVSEESPVFSPDGRSLAYTAIIGRDFDAGERGTTGIHILTEGQGITEIDTKIMTGTHHLVWMEGGDRIAFRAFCDGTACDEAGVYAIDLESTGELVPFLTREARDGISGIAWSDAAHTLAFTTVGTPAGNNLTIWGPDPFR